MRPAFRRGWEGEGKPNRRPGAGQRATPATRGRLFCFGKREGKALGVPAKQTNGGGQPPLSRIAAQKRHPRMARRRRMPCWRTPNGHRCCAISAAPPCPRRRETGGRLARREARVPAGQNKNAAPSGARSAGESATSETPAHLPRSRSSPERPRLQAWSAKRIERVALRAAT